MAQNTYGDLETFSTRSIHAGLHPEPTTGAVVTPLIQSTTYRQSAVGEHKGYTYSRAGNPTVSAFEEHLAAIEGARGAVAFSSGLSAITTLFLTELKAGDHVICSDAVYGGTVRLLNLVFADLGVEASFIDTSDLSAIEREIRPRTKLFFIESPGNPTLKLTDIAAVCGIAKPKKIKVAVDNTFLTVYLQDVLALGADIAVYSTTKYIEGHNSTVGGALIANDDAFLERARLFRKSIGCIQSPFESWLTIRGLKTLPLRLERHSSNAFAVARYLQSHPLVASVAYPWLESFPQYELAKKQQKSGGGIVSFELKGGAAAGIKLMNSVKLCTLAENLGAVDTIITHPVSMTHGDVPREQRERIGITDGLVRISVGLESSEDIIKDLEQALAQTLVATKTESGARA